jgi:hypothetical protein
MANFQTTLRANAALSATENGADQDNAFCTGAVVTIVTANRAASGSFTLKLQGKTKLGTYYDIPGAVTAAIVTNTTTTLIVAPGATASSNAVVNVPLPRVWRYVITVSAGTYDCSVTADLLK